jgi:thiosulfate/3-mercaptopyruvate sulfurtransferase
MKPRWTSLVDASSLMAALDSNISLIDARAQSSVGVRLVDARASLADAQGGAALYAQGHIPGAVYADLNRDLADLGKTGHGRHPLPDSGDFAERLGRWGVAADTQVVVYDAGDGSMAAARLWWLLKLIGHSEVAVLDGGFAAWQDAGGDVTRTLTQVPALAAYPGSFNLDRVVSAEQIAQRLSQSPGWLFDARAPERFSGQVEPIDPVAGHVPGAINLPFARMLENGRFRPAQQLHDALRGVLGQTDPADAVVMCGSGVTACHLLLAMEWAGLPGASLYADSWSGWISDVERPVARD